MNKDFTIVIPARRNSKGLPFKNRLLIEKTLNELSLYDKTLNNSVIINTDDEFIIDQYSGKYKTYIRDPKLSLDETSIKSVILDMIGNNIIKTENIILLYLTYPERKLNDILDAVIFYNKNNCKSLLCRKEIKTAHPFLHLLDVGDFKGEQLYKHNLYRRQDYPKMFEISHFISIFNIKEVNNLNDNLYNINTLFYHIDDKYDIDTVNDLNGYLQKEK